jgi:AraC-like DNA-binding protein
MRYIRPEQLLTGFHAERPDDAVPELVHAGEQWAPARYFIGTHAHDEWDFYLQLDGSTEWTCRAGGDGGAHALRPGHFFAAPPRVRHAMRDRPRARHHFFFAAVDLAPVLARHPSLRPLWRDAAAAGCATFSNAQGLEPAFRQLIREVSMRLPHRSEGLRAALDYLVIETSRLFEAGDGRAILPMHPAVQKAKDLLDRDFAEPWHLADLGRLVGVSPNHLVHLFTREVGVSPHRYLLRRRIDQAKQRLRDTELPVTKLARELGFSSSQHFAKAFRAATKTSAVVFRRECRRGDAGESRRRDGTKTATKKSRGR